MNLFNIQKSMQNIIAFFAIMLLCCNCSSKTHKIKSSLHVMIDKKSNKQIVVFAVAGLGNSTKVAKSSRYKILKTDGRFVFHLNDAMTLVTHLGRDDIPLFFIPKEKKRFFLLGITKISL